MANPVQGLAPASETIAAVLGEPAGLACLRRTADWNIAPSPMMKDWPRTLLTTVMFEEAGDQARLRFTWVPHEASAAEIACFRAAIASMDKGWAAGMELLRKLLPELQT
jgi:hypothetical protein